MYDLTPSHHVQAISRLRLWLFERQALKSGHTVEYRRTGWRERRLRDHDARIVRCLDFEKALSRLTHEEQAALLARYRDGLQYNEAAAVVGCSVRKLAYLLPIALGHLADVLDRLNLL
jgi:DNA-directed RNA polymerase specialized sigma24 family protein